MKRDKRIKGNRKGELGNTLTLWNASPSETVGLNEALELITFLKEYPVYGGNTVKLSVPTYWRELKWDSVSDPLLHEIIRKADIVSPWSVRRFVLPETGRMALFNGHC